jgi:hypothetical protein
MAQMGVTNNLLAAGPTRFFSSNVSAGNKPFNLVKRK